MEYWIQKLVLPWENWPKQRKGEAESERAEACEIARDRKEDGLIGGRLGAGRRRQHQQRAMAGEGSSGRHGSDDGARWQRWWLR